MAYTTEQLTARYTAANLGKAPDAATGLTIAAYAQQSQVGGISDDTALANTLKLVNNTTAVVVATYQFFNGAAPSAAGLDYFVDSTANANDLNDANGLYAKFSAENRFINFAVNLGTGGANAAAFASTYGAVSITQAIASAYDNIIGNAAATAAGVDVAAATAYIGRQANIDFLTTYLRGSGFTGAQLDVALRAALVGQILNIAVTSGIGGYAKATAALIADLSDGTLSTDSATGVNIFTAYPAAPIGGNTTALTTGIDTLVGTTGNDTFTASQNATTGALLTSLDSIDGGAGVDTLVVTDAITATGVSFAFPTTATIKNVEVFNVTTTGELTDFDTSAYAGVTTVVANSADAGAATQKITVSDTTALTVSVASGDVETVGGSTVVVTNAGTGTTDVNGDALTSVSITGGGVATISDNGEATLASVTLKSVNADTDITSDSVNTITVGGTTSTTRTVTINNTEDHNLTINAQGTNTAAGAATATVVDDATAEAVAVNASGKATINLTTAAATAVTSSGAGALTLDLTGAAAAASFNGSAATGGITLTGNGTALKTISTGAGADTFTVNTGTAKATVSSGAGDDVVTINGVLAAGSVINLGAGNDKLLGTNEVAVSTSTAVTVIDGGAGIDTLGAALVNNGNGSQFTGFEILGLNSVAGLDLALLTNNTGITGLELVAGGRGTYSNVNASQALSITGDAAAATTLTFTGVSGTADAYGISFAGTGGATKGAAVAVNAGTVSITGIETVNLASTSASGFTTNTIALTDADARVLNITGSQALNLSFVTAFGKTGSGNGVSLIDASTASGGLNLNTANLAAASGGLTVKTGAGADTLVLNVAATVDLGAGADSVTLAAAGGTVTTGAGADTVNVAATVAGTGLTFLTTITDATAGDKIVFAAGASATETFNATKIDASGFQTLQDALNAAAAGDGSVAGTTTISWFQYGGNTYVVEDLGAGATFAGTDIAVKLTGLVDLSTATYSAASNTLTLA